MCDLSWRLLKNGGLVLATIFGFLLSSTAERKATLNYETDAVTQSL